MDQERVFGKVLERKVVILVYENINFKKGQKAFFPRGNSMVFVKKFRLFPSFFEHKMDKEKKNS